MIVLMNENSVSREVLLRSAWSRNFIQLTILDVVKKNFGRNLMFDRNQRNIIIHYFNKFTQNYTMINYVKGDVIFPTKLKDLNGFEIKTCTDSETKQEYEEQRLKVNLEGDPNEVLVFDYYNEPPEEFEEEKLNTFSKVMNFKRVRLHPDECIRNKDKITTHLTCDEVLHNYKENICHISEKDNTDEHIYRIENDVYFLKSPHQQILIPKKRINNYMFTKSIYQGALTFLLVFVIWKFLRFLKFNKQFWKLWFLWLALLGISIPLEVKKLTDRIVFISIFLGFFMFSSELHNLLTTVQLVIDYEDVFLDSEFITNWSMRGTTIGTENHASDVITLQHEYKNLPFKKSDGLHHNVEECLKELFAYKAVACKVHIKDIRNVLLMDSKINKISTIKIFLTEEIENLYFAVENNSPYTSEFERHMNRFIETGLFVKWDKENFKTNLNYSMIEDIILSNRRNDEINISPFHILLIGLGISIIAFFGEIFNASVQKVWKSVQRLLLKVGLHR
ncbi:uncharacterized protein LOC127278089 [Leptopilina boulardi]|uniref:uncharacterized protein LOC127278089 n=1 Tax=Leptopilina boulardi TaxID=63433 RepID=UPI0021F59B41|nr:uncharacterized protein LOC127278089 [Leptopilina boulardi]